MDLGAFHEGLLQSTALVDLFGVPRFDGCVSHSLGSCKIAPQRAIAGGRRIGCSRISAQAVGHWSLRCWNDARRVGCVGLRIKCCEEVNAKESGEGGVGPGHDDRHLAFGLSTRQRAAKFGIQDNLEALAAFWVSPTVLGQRRVNPHRWTFVLLPMRPGHLQHQSRQILREGQFCSVSHSWVRQPDSGNVDPSSNLAIHRERYSRGADV